MSSPEVFKLYKSTKDSGWITATLESGVAASENGYGGFKGIRYRKIGNRVYIEGSISTTWNGSSNQLLAAIPAEFRPTGTRYGFVPLTGTNIARIIVSSTTGVFLEWVRSMVDGSTVTSELSWIAINIEYPVD